VTTPAAWVLEGCAAANAAVNVDPPDEQFTVIPQPSFLSMPRLRQGLEKSSIDRLEAIETFQKWLDLRARELGFNVAFLVALERAQGAAQAGNTFWQSAQLQTAAVFFNERATLAAEETALLPEIQEKGQNAFPAFSVTKEQVEEFQRQVKEEGLPDFLKDFVRQFSGAESQTLEKSSNAVDSGRFIITERQIRDSIIEADPNHILNANTSISRFVRMKMSF
jgi:hypothetical protein